MADQSIPLKISVAPFPEGFEGDMDETFQQACLLMEATVEGAFLTGLILPPGSALPTTNVGPVAVGNVWYFWDPATNQYLPQSLSARPAKNYVKNGGYQIQQTGANPALVAGVNKIYDMCLTRMTNAGVLTVTVDVGPLATADHDTCPAAIKYTVPNPSPTLAAADVYIHEHLIEGSDLAPIQNEVLSVSFLCWVNQPGTYSVYLTNGGRDASYCATFVMTTANVWTRIKIEDIPALPTGTGTWSFSEGATGLYIGVVMAIGSQWQTANLKAWNSGFFAGASTNSNMVAVANNQMKIAAMRLEASPQAGYASINAFAQDYEECIRYYFTTFTYQSVTAGIPIFARIPLAAQWMMGELFPRRMCKTPVVTPFGYTSKASGNITNLTLNKDVALAAIAATPKGLSDSQTATLVTTGNTNTTITITNIPTTAALAVGMGVSGAGIPAGATIATVASGTSITLSAAATATATGVALTFNLINKGDTVAAFITADARLV